MSLRILVALMVAASPFGAAMADGGAAAGERPLASPHDLPSGFAETERSGDKEERPAPPTIRITKGYAVDGKSAYRQLPLEGTAEPKTDYVMVQIDGRRTYYARARRDGAWDFTVDLRPGKRTITAVAVDRKGNESKPSKPLTVEIIRLQSTVDLRRLDGEDGAAWWLPGFGGNCSGLVAATDLDRDGLGDVLIGGFWAAGSDDEGKPVGKIFGVMGSENGWPSKVDVSKLPVGRGFQIVSGAGNQRKPAPVASAGDVDADGYGDFAVLTEGSLAVVYGQRKGLPATTDLRKLEPENGFRIIGKTAYSGPSQPVEGIGDFNGDGVGDIVVRARRTLYVVFGKRGRTRGELALDDFGREDGVQLDLRNPWVQVSLGGGDVDGDGIADLIVGVVGSSAQGTISIIFGGKRPPAKVALVDYARSSGVHIQGAAAEWDPLTVASGFDLNRDGRDDLIALTDQSPLEDANGKAIVLYGAERSRLRAIDLDRRIGSRTGFRLVGDTPSWRLQSAAAAGDVNGDGLDDLVLGASNGGANVGYLLYGWRERPAELIDPTKLDGLYGYRLQYSGSPSTDEPGCTVAGAGDVNGDGLDDIVVSGKSEKRIDQPGAAAYVVFGRRE